MVSAFFSPGSWEAWMRFFLEDGGMHWKRLVLELRHHVGEWYLDFKDSVYLTMVFIRFLVSWMASIFPDMIHEVFWMISHHEMFTPTCDDALWGKCIGNKRFQHKESRHPTMTFHPSLDVHIIPFKNQRFSQQFFARWFTANQLKPRRGFRATVLQIGFMMELWFVLALSTKCVLKVMEVAGEDGTCQHV